MLLTIHNLPVQTQYQDVKQLILTKCGLEDAILDNLQNEGSGMRVTVGVSEEEDAAILVRKINGLFYGGQQLYVQNKRQKRELDQPYRSNVAQPQFVPQTQPIYDYSQVQAMGMFPTGQMTMYPARPVTQAVQGVYMAYGQQQYSEAVMPQYAGPLNEFGNPAYDQGDFGLVQSEKLFASSADVSTPGQPGQGQASPQWEQKPPQRENRRLQKDGPSQRFGGRPQKEEGPPQRFGGPPKSFGGRPQRDDRSPQRFGGRSQRDNGRPDKDYGLPQRYNERQQRFEGRQQKDDGRPQRYQGQLQTFDERLQRDEGRPQRDDRGPQIYDRRPQRDDRRRPASPFRPNRAPETEPDPKRPKRDSRDDRFNRNDPQSRFREEPERSANSTRFDNRAKISGQTRWDAPRSDQRPELFIRREPPARIACNDTESDWKAWNPTAGQVDMPNQSSTTYNEFGLDPTMPDHSPAKFNKFNQGPSKAEQGSTAYNKFGLSSFITGQGSTTNTYGAGSSKTDQGSTFNSFGQSSSMPFQGPATYNKFNQGLSVPDPNSTKNKHKYSTVADQHNIKYNMFTDGTDMRNQGSTKYHKVKAKETIMSQIVANANAKDILNGPSTFKNLLRKICAARIDDAVGTDEMFNDEIVRRYRSKYPTSGDQKLYNDIQKKLLECPNMNFKEMWEWALVMVPGARKPPIFPPKPPPPREKVARPPAAPKGPLPKPIGPFASKNKYDLCVGKLSAHVMYDMSRTLDFDFQLSENHRVRTLLRKAVAARVGDIVVKMEAAPAHILPHYRKKYPRKTDKELYDKALIALERQLTAQSIKEFGESCVIPSQPKPNKAPNTAVPSQTVPNKAPNTAAADGTVNKIPKYPQGDKNVHRQEKKQHIQDLRSMTQFDNDGTFKQALDKEMEAIGTLMQNILNNPETRDEKLIYGDMKKGNMVTECTKLIGHHISKRLTDRGPKLVRIYGHPKPPKRSDLEDFLCKNKFNCISLKKSVTSPFYTASFDSYATIDALCSLPPVLVGSDIAVEFKYMHIFKSSLMNDNTKKVKMSKKARKNLIKKMVENLIDESKVNLLDKDWPAQEEAEKKAKAEKNKTCDESEDVIHVDNEIKTIDITGDDDEDGNDKTNDNDNNITEREFLNDEFQVIDEVRESEDDGPVEEEKDKNEISDDWDQTGEDWGDETGGGDTASDKNAGDGGQGHDENAIETSFGENNDLGETDDEIGDVIGENAEDIDIADVEFDEDDLEDY